MPQLSRLQTSARRALLRNADLLYRHPMPGEPQAWSDGAACRFSVQDPNKVQSGLALSLRQQPDALLLRILKVQPGDPLPAVGASILWQGYALIVVSYSDVPDWSGVPTGTARLER